VSAWRGGRAAAAAAAVCAIVAAGEAAAGLPQVCALPPRASAAQQDRVLRLAAIVRGELERSGATLALISRSGLALDRFGFRYSHAGLSLRANPHSAWSVRQLYYDCDEQRPRLYDQGLAGFLLGDDAPSTGHVSLLLLPPDAAVAVERQALDDRAALALLGPHYSANAYPFSVRYQNCNQWVAEMLAGAWARGDEAAAVDGPRAAAQTWLQRQGYAPSVFEWQPWPLEWLAPFVPLAHTDDHPRQDLERGRNLVSMPAALEGFVRQRMPATQRLEFCRNDRHVVIRRGWEPIADGCEPEAGDSVVAFGR